jgi:hypothetical protein
MSTLGAEKNQETDIRPVGTRLEFIQPIEK